MFNLNKDELQIFKKLSSPVKIQDYLDTIPINWEKAGDTYYSPRMVLRENKAHCIEGALFAAAALWVHGHEPLLMDMKATEEDDDHVVALFKTNGYWGAISKTNHATVRYRDPIYRTLRELALSSFHEYFLNASGKKVLKSYSRPLNLKRFGEEWVTTERKLDDVALALDELPHYDLVPRRNRHLIRSADAFERRAGEASEWDREDPRT